MVQVKIVNESNNQLPQYETEGSVGMDVRAFIEDDQYYDIAPGEMKMVSTGLFVAIPQGYEIQIRPRSGMAAKSMVTVMNAPGTIDSDYRGEIKVLLVNHHPTQYFQVHTGDRIAQMVLSEKPVMVLEQVMILSETDRGIGGFGHTGKK